MSTKATTEEEIPADDRRRNVYAATAFVLLMVFIGLPQWWRTTRVYRASLPYGEISTFKDAVLVLPVSVALISGDDMVNRAMKDGELAAAVLSGVAEEYHRLQISLELTQRQASDAEKPILASQFKSFAELESNMYKASIGNRGRKVHTQDIKGDGVEIFILHRPNEQLNVHFGATSRMFVIVDLEKTTPQELSKFIADIILHGYLRLDELLATVARNSKEDIHQLNTSKRSLSTAVLQPKVTLEFHVVDPEPIQCSQRFTPAAIVDDPMVKDFLSAIRDVTDVSVKSQILYYVEFQHQPIEDKSGAFYLNPSQLQHMINPIETYLGTVVTTEPIYHILLYLPPSSVSPLMVPSSDRLGTDLRPAPYNSFVVSGWGCVIIANSNRTCNDGLLYIDPGTLKQTRTAVVANLRKLFGLQLPREFQQTVTVPIADWEVQSLRYRAVVEYIFSAIRTLNSLTKLLGEVTNIVINDDIAASIGSSVEEIQNVLNAAASSGDGGHWRMHSMLKSATLAFEQSEKAFFDPSLLAMLYFPDDQKYAIYVPLFLPIGVPVIGSIVFIYKYFKKNPEKDKKE